MPRMILSTGEACDAKCRFKLQRMTKSTLKSRSNTVWESRMIDIMNHRWWKRCLQILPWLGLTLLLIQIRERSAGMLVEFWSSALWIGNWTWTIDEDLTQRVSLVCLIPVLSLWVDSMKWTLLMYPNLGYFARFKLAWQQIPRLAYSMLGSMALPGRLSEFAGRCRFYPTEQHPRVMASTLMASTTQWFWVLVLPALWILGTWLVNVWTLGGFGLTPKVPKGLPNEFWSALTNPVLGFVGLGLAIIVLMIWYRLYQRTQLQSWTWKTMLQVYGWSWIRYGFLLLQWVLWLHLANVTINTWILMGLVGSMMALQWFMPLGFLMDLGFKGAVSLWLWGNVLKHAGDALVIPLMIWLTNIILPALCGAIWWTLIGYKFKEV